MVYNGIMLIIVAVASGPYLAWSVLPAGAAGVLVFLLTQCPGPGADLQ